MDVPFLDGDVIHEDAVDDAHFVLDGAVLAEHRVLDGALVRQVGPLADQAVGAHLSFSLRWRGHLFVREQRTPPFHHLNTVAFKSRAEFHVIHQDSVASKRISHLT